MLNDRTPVVPLGRKVKLEAAPAGKTPNLGIQAAQALLSEKSGFSDFEERVIEINRTSKKTKGGNRFSFTALLAVGDRNGKVGLGLGRASVVGEAIKKAVRRAKRKMFSFELTKDKTIVHAVRIKKGAVEIILRPSVVGTGVRAGGPLRPFLEVTGIQNITGRILGSNNKKANVYAVLEALINLKKASQRFR